MPLTLPTFGRLFLAARSVLASATPDIGSEPTRRTRSSTAADAEAVTSVRGDLSAYAKELAVDHLRVGFWPVAGAVLVNLRNILDALDPVADAQPVAVPRPTLPPQLRHRPDPSKPARSVS